MPHYTITFNYIFFNAFCIILYYFPNRSFEIQTCQISDIISCPFFCGVPLLSESDYISYPRLFGGCCAEVFTLQIQTVSFGSWSIVKKTSTQKTCLCGLLKLQKKSISLSLIHWSLVIAGQTKRYRTPANSQAISISLITGVYWRCDRGSWMNSDVLSDMLSTHI